MQFAKEDNSKTISSDSVWKILIVDDDLDVHQITKLALYHFTFENKHLKIYNAYNKTEALDILTKEKDIALVLLDVVMETSDAGLQTVKHIRDTIKNNLVRIVLRTGQPGYAPELEVIKNYDINDYKEKTDLTTDKLYAVIISSLRAYKNIKLVNDNNLILKKIVHSNATVFKTQSFELFSKSVLLEMIKILPQQSDDIDAFCIIEEDNDYLLLEALGRFQDETVDTIISLPVKERIEKADTTYLDGTYLYQYTINNKKIIYYIAHTNSNEIIISFMNLFSINVSIAFENINLMQEVSIQQEEKLTNMSKIISMIAHQWRQPLTSIGMIMNNMSLDIDLDDIDQNIWRNNIDSVNTQIQSLSTTIDNFRNYYNQDSQKTNFDILETLKNSIQHFSSYSDIIISFNSTLSKQIVNYESDISKVFSNILQNAIDSLQVSQKEKKITIDMYEADKELYIVIKDNGKGIKADNIDKVFEPYFSTKEEKNGTGLGMYMSKLLICEYCDGRIDIKSNNQETEVRVILPVE